FAYGAITIGFGFAAGGLGGVLRAALVVNGTVAGPLLGVFLLGVLLPFVNSKGAISGMLIAHAISLTIGFGGLAFGKHAVPLPFSIDNCSNETLSKVSNLTAVYERHFKALHAQPEVVEGFEKIFNISYLLYPLVGTFVTIIVGCIVSLLTGPSEMTKDDEKYIHPLVVKLIRMVQGKKPSASTVHATRKNDHEMSWRNGNGSSAGSWNNDMPRTNGKPIRIGGQSMYDNAAFQET
ncbi:Sodium-coupled monocarboxylate transporter 1, partial [Orchesella cincta]